MFLKEYLSIQESIDLVYELTSKPIDYEILEELSNTNQITPVFLFSGYVGCAEDGVTIYERMKAYFTHNDLFLHKTSNYQNYSMYGDADVPEWIEINLPLTIQKIFSQQMSIYSVLDEVFLFTQTPTSEIGKQDAIKLSTVNFCDVRFSRNELLNLFEVKKSSVSNINTLISKAPPPPNHIKTTSSFNQSTPLTVGDLIKSSSLEKVISPNNYQRVTMLYNYFTPHQASCLIAGLHPNFNGSNDDLEIAQGLIKSGLKKGKIKLDDEGEIEAYDLQLYLARLGWVLEGFNISLSLSFQDSMQKSDSTNLELDKLTEQLKIEKVKSNNLQKIIDKLNLQVEKPADDLKDVPHQSYRTVARVMYAMAQLAKVDNSKPFSQNKPSLNASITTILQNDGVPLESEAVGKWLSRINDIKSVK